MNVDVEKMEVKAVLVGDSCVGKTSAVVTYTTNLFPEAAPISIYDVYSTDLIWNKEQIRLKIHDTGG